MTNQWTLGVFAATLLAAPLAAQSGSGAAPVTMPAGKYLIEAHDTTKAFPPIDFELKSNGNWVITMADGTFSGKLKTGKDGVTTYSDQGCLDDKDSHQREGSYLVRSERGAFWLEVQSDPCEGRGASLAQWMFRPVKK